MWVGGDRRVQRTTHNPGQRSNRPRYRVTHPARGLTRRTDGLLSEVRIVHTARAPAARRDEAPETDAGRVRCSGPQKVTETRNPPSADAICLVGFFRARDWSMSSVWYHNGESQYFRTTLPRLLLSLVVRHNDDATCSGSIE